MERKGRRGKGYNLMELNRAGRGEKEVKGREWMGRKERSKKERRERKPGEGRKGKEERDQAILGGGRERKKAGSREEGSRKAGVHIDALGLFN